MGTFRFEIRLSPERFTTLRVAVAKYAAQHGISEEEAWREVERRMEADLGRRVLAMIRES